MAYREFHNEKYFASPDVPKDAFMHTINGVADMLDALAARKKQKALAADQYKFDLGQGKFENDDKIFFERGLDITQRSRQDIATSGRISPQMQDSQNTAIMDKKSSDWQYQAMTDMGKVIEAKSKEDIYFDPQIDTTKLREAAYGKDNEVNYLTRGERLEAYNNEMLRDPRSLRGKVYTSDYVKLFGKKEQTKNTEDPNTKSSVYSASPFITPQGVPGVTVDHAKEYLNSRPDGSVARWVENLVDKDMDSDLRYMKERSAKLKDMSDDEAKLYLKAHPSENTYNPKDYAARVIEKAQSELSEAADINRKTDYETKVDKSVTGGLYNNDGIGHSYSEHLDNVEHDTVAKGAHVNSYLSQMNNAMPGGNLRIGKGAKVGQAIPLDLNPIYSLNVRNGKVNSNVGSTAFNLTGYQLAAYDKDGKPMLMTEEAIKTMPLAQLKNLAPQLGIALRGYTINRGNQLGEIASRQSTLDDEYATAVKSGDIEKQTSIDQQRSGLNALKQKFNLSPSEFSDEDMMSAMKQNGISVSQIKQDMIVKPSPSDIQVLDKNVTKGLNLNDKSKWSGEMKSLDDVYQKRYQQAQSFDESVKKEKPVKKAAAKQPKPVPAGFIRVKHPNGQTGVIPQEDLQQALQEGYQKVN